MKINDNHRFSPEARMIEAANNYFLNAIPQSLDNYNRCEKIAESYENKSKHKKLKRYYAIIKETCLIHKARISYKNNDFTSSINQFDEIRKQSYKWPYLLLEKAWANYYLKDYNRSLGLLVSYKSPLLKSYFLPESEVLAALSYFRLCLWDDALKTVEQFQKVYKPQSEHLKKMLVQNKNSTSYFFKLMFSSSNNTKRKNPYLRNLITQIRKKVKFSVDLVSYKKARNELKEVNRLKSSSFKKIIREELVRTIAWRSQHLNHYIKLQILSFINKIHRFSYDLFNIQLEVMSKKRELLYKNEKLVSNRGRGDLSNVNRRSDQHFWDFRGSFWADEIGDYSFGLKSNCKVLKQEGQE